MAGSDDDRVYYCRKCLSLAVLQFQCQDYCKECGSTDIGEIPIGEWEELYNRKYNKNFINHNKPKENGRSE